MAGSWMSSFLLFLIIATIIVVIFARRNKKSLNGNATATGTRQQSQTDFKRKRNGMIEFIRRVYHGFVLVAFWIILIGFAVGGGIVGKASGGYRGDYTAYGVIIGLIVGFVIAILLCGYIATILNIDANLEKLRLNAGDNNTLSEE